jgi:hypothetical protein
MTGAVIGGNGSLYGETALGAVAIVPIWDVAQCSN